MKNFYTDFLAINVLLCCSGAAAMNFSNNDMFKRTPLHFLAYKEKEGVMTMKKAEGELRLGADPNAVDIMNETPLHYAARADFSELACLLLRCGADCAIENVNGHTPLDVAGRATEKLLQLHRQCSSPMLEDDDVNEDELQNTLFVAASTGELHTLNFLCECNVPINKEAPLTGYTALHSAVIGKQPMSVRVLLQHRANIEAEEYRGYTPLALAIQLGYSEVVRKLLRYGASLTAKTHQGTSITQLAANAKNRYVRALVNGAIIQEQHRYGFTCPCCNMPRFLTFWGQCAHMLCIDCKKTRFLSGVASNSLCPFGCKQILGE